MTSIYSNCANIFTSTLSKLELLKVLRIGNFSNYLEYAGKRNGNLYSEELIELFPDDFENYDITIEEYEKNIRIGNFRNFYLSSFLR